MIIPHLSQKLQFLYARHETVKTHEDLAKLLAGPGGMKGINLGNISQWIHGIEGIRPPNSVPEKHLVTICSIFLILEKTLQLESIEEFKAVVDGHLWQAISICAENYEGLKLLRRTTPKVLKLYNTNRQPFDQFAIGDSVYVEFSVPRAWQNFVAEGECFLFILSIDDDKTTCLYPLSGQQYHRLNKQILTIPENLSELGLLVSGSCGDQHLLALLSRFRIEDRLYNELHSANIDAALNRLAAELVRLQYMAKQEQSDVDAWTLFKYSYTVL